MTGKVDSFAWAQVRTHSALHHDAEHSHSQHKYEQSREVSSEIASASGTQAVLASSATSADPNSQLSHSEHVVQSAQPTDDGGQWHGDERRITQQNPIFESVCFPFGFCRNRRLPTPSSGMRIVPLH